MAKNCSLLPRTHAPFNSSLSLCVIIHLPNGVCPTLRDWHFSLTPCARHCVLRNQEAGKDEIEGHSFTQGFVTGVRPFVLSGSTGGVLERKQEKWQTFALLWTKLGIMGCRMTAANCDRPDVIGSIVWGEHWVEFLISLMGVLHWINYTCHGATHGQSEDLVPSWPLSGVHNNKWLCNGCDGYFAVEWKNWDLCRRGIF